MLDYWIIARSAAGNCIGAECLVTPPSSGHLSHSIALTPEFQRLLVSCWPGCRWLMVDPQRYLVYRPETGAIGTLTLLASPQNSGQLAASQA